MPTQYTHCATPITGPSLPLDVGDIPHAITTGNNVPIALIDTGAANPGTSGDRDHCLLHGTAVASVLKSIAPGADIRSVRHSPHPERSNGTVADLVNAINRALQEKPTVLNISMVTCEDTPQLRDAIARAHKQNVLVVASVGNRGQCDEKTAPYPAMIDGVLAVGAVEPRHPDPTTGTWDAGRVVAHYNAPGPWADIYAPGGPVSAQLTMDGKVHTIVGDPQPFTGTSFAAPVVSATAALVWQILPDAPANLVRSIMLDSAHPGGASPGTSVPIRVINPQAAVELALSHRDKHTFPPSQHHKPDQHAHTFHSEDHTLELSVQAHPIEPVHNDYSVPGALSLLVFVVGIVTLIARALSSERRPAFGNTDNTRHGADCTPGKPNTSISSSRPIEK
ncbi:S8 family serine peptidase [Corynebacterium sp. 4HC-13]|uniref:S8 family serine peptidase n=1 Tax=Corynebacterium anserum TaxID=2684406 RepID=A0A7G7YPY5_9CORY|nr:S8 family serine peptidase [Corynebacterium anserum]QNH96555.1 S8 family serine peptidase [Corynebacterium anserum]